MKCDKNSIYELHERFYGLQGTHWHTLYKTALISLIFEIYTSHLIIFFLCQRKYFRQINIALFLRRDSQLSILFGGRDISKNMISTNFCEKSEIKVWPWISTKDPPLNNLFFHPAIAIPLPNNLVIDTVCLIHTLIFGKFSPRSIKIIIDIEHFGKKHLFWNRYNKSIFCSILKRIGPAGRSLSSLSKEPLKFAHIKNS